MVSDMRTIRLVVCVAACLVIPVCLQARCRTPDLHTPIHEFTAARVSRLDALLRLGQEQNVCFAVEYVDGAMLTEPHDFHLTGTTIGDAVRSILGDEEHSLVVDARNGLIVISRTPRPAGIFDYLIPKWETRRGSVQDMSIGLHMQFVMNLNPCVKGFAGDYPTADLQDQVGPFNEYNHSVGYLLDKIITESTGAAWIAEVPWNHIGDVTLVEARRVWTIVEYGGTNADYSTALREITAGLGPGKKSEGQR